MTISKFPLTRYLLILLLLLPVFIPLTYGKGKVSSRIIVGNQSGIFKSGETVKVFYYIKNENNYRALLSIGGSLANTQKKVVKYIKQQVILYPGESKKIPFTFVLNNAGFYSIYLNIKQKNIKISENSLRIGYALEKLSNKPKMAQNFSAFWTQTKIELASIPAKFKIIPKKHLDTKYYSMYVIEMQSLNNYTIRAWYRKPKNKYNVPIVLQLPSLGGSFFNPPSLGKRPKTGVPLDFAVLGLNIRGHGNSKDDVDIEDFHYEYITKDLNVKERYMYRGAIADCIRALDFIETRKEINQNQIIVEGASQGGGLSLILAGLDKRIDIACPDVPFLCNINALYTYAKWFRKSIKKYMETHKIGEWRAKYHLSYFDAMNFASKINIPILLSVGLQDHVCHPITAISCFNHIPSFRKKLMVYPYGKHDGGGKYHRSYKFNWIRSQLR